MKIEGKPLMDFEKIWIDSGNDLKIKAKIFSYFKKLIKLVDNWFNLKFYHSFKFKE